MDPDRAAADLGAVEDEVISFGPDLVGVRLEEREVFFVRRGEGVVHRDEALFLFAPLEEREVGHPAEGQAVPAASVLDGPGPADLAEGLERDFPFAGDEQGQVAVGAAEGGPDPFVVGLGRLEGGFPPFLLLDPDEALGPERFGLLDELVELAAGEGAGPGDEQALDLAARAEDGLEDLGGGVTADLREVAHLERHPQVRFVRAVFLHGLGIRKAPERPLDLAADEREERLHQALVEGEEILTVDEARLDVDLGELELAVGPQGLVPEAADDLEIAVAAGDHQGLLELLGRLGQGVEPAVADAARDEEIARPLRGRVGQDRRFDLEVAVPAQVVPGGERGLVAQADVALHPGPAQVEVAVLQPQLLGGLGRVGDDERRHLRGREDVKLEGLDLDLARGDVLVDGGPSADKAPDPDHEFGAEPLGFLGELRPVGLEDDLGQAFAVAQVDEDEMAHVAGLVDPAAEDDLAAIVGGAQGAAVVRPLQGRGGLVGIVHGIPRAASF